MKLGGVALLEQAIRRGQACGSNEIIIVANQDYLFLIQNLVAEMENPPLVRYPLEPKGRNTAPAIALASLYLAKEFGEDCVLIVLPAYQLIPDITAYVAYALNAARLALQGRLVVFGIQPTSPETGFGYLEIESTGTEPQMILRFVEKPDADTAQSYLESGRFFWNSGMFCFTAQSMLDDLETYSPEVLISARNVLATATKEDVTHSVTRFDANLFSQQPEISINYAVMEHADNVTMISSKFSWSDIGTWPAVAQAYTANANGNTLACKDHIECIDVDTRNTHVHIETQGHKQVVATIGIEDTVIAHTPDALLVADKSRSQEVRKIVEALKQRHIDGAQYKSTLTPHTVNRPWGTYTTLKEESGFKVKCITVRPGQKLSLQYHHHRSEHWTIIRGHGIVQIGEAEYITGPGEHRYIPLGEKHRLTNSGEEELVLVEVQIGRYLGEDDIFRLSDIYGRT